MKRLILLAAMLMLLSACGSKTYSLPRNGRFCFRDTANGEAEIVLDQEAREYIIDVLNSGQWMNELTQCLDDYFFRTRGPELRYHADCGTFNDGMSRRHLTVTEEQRQKINAYLGAEEKKH